MNDIEQLKSDIAEFEAFKESIDRQQLTFPLDKKSLDVMREDLIVPTGKVTTPVNVLTVTGAFEVIVDGKRYLLYSTQ